MPPFRKRGRRGGRKSPLGAFSLVGSLSLNSAQLVIELDTSSINLSIAATDLDYVKVLKLLVQRHPSATAAACRVRLTMATAQVVATQQQLDVFVPRTVASWLQGGVYKRYGPPLTSADCGP